TSTLLDMRTSQLAVTGLAATAGATSLANVCTTSYATAKLPLDELDGATIDTSSLTAQAFYNVTVTDEYFYPDSTFDYCNVTFAYSHSGRNDRVQVTYWLPDPSKFQNRFLATGGGGLAINSGTGSVAGGMQYGAAAGLTDGGFGSFDNEFDDVFLLHNNTVNWESTYLFGFQAIHEMTLYGKAFAANFYGISNTTDAATYGMSNSTAKTNSTSKIYAYYQGCSEGGREGWSQVQRFAETYDGAAIGAPAFRYSFQQVNHLASNVQEMTLGYYPPPCELTKILNETFAFCDPLDGKTDGVVSRTDLCKLQFNVNSTIGLPYYCAAEAAPTFKHKRQMAAAATPEQNGTVTAEGAAIAQLILDGLKDNSGNQVYVPYQPSSTFTDAATQYNSETGEWELDQSGLGSEWVYRFLQLQNASVIPDAEFAEYTYDTLADWMVYGLHTYDSVLQTTWPDLGAWRDAGNKVIHYHGESDYSIPTASSVRYWDSVREFMYPELGYNDSAEAVSDFYKFYSVPGATHCAANPLEPNGPFPQTNLAVLIDWVENGIVPETLNATVLQGEYIGENRQICEWPLRPFWPSENATMECVYDQTSLDTWSYDLNFTQFKIY
ncbi:Tannase, partial [Lachnellula suecica]